MAIEIPDYTPPSEITEIGEVDAERVGYGNLRRNCIRSEKLEEGRVGSKR